ncbi:tRNA adenosine(34) deaminase TadA [Aetokthonos hydrillicola Thurmond2011]|jgi:tRNA(adenine34) deaminase|uniref:tRNA-specific adenosine deaminase n=1 Tax=Aetokthonos hydrillicola Thurmond2011 TaxID=2712845 RepID=A0AAP5M871_9CYAN|nr:tRNA adenosine(34) deaminase TadA [Aetokthonos hydrillicola]MBO3460630.1 nucleoside deaminase [Aetokthonos hydrillicola CCALA 1050]MBW4587789.1 tRNA adenosine(34) deaminase TadA [Aetokthonos hydrillicola CCALA 1050]MDR9894437.1 tRNA adenosine(34) deaminase TadA [Aetokthonos hydrillicola Thurmond2011]
MSLEYSEYLKDREWISHSLKLAQAAGEQGEIPVGAVVVNLSGNLIAEGENRKERDQDPTAHAEIVAIRKAANILGTWRLNECTLYVTLEPCPMCAGAIVQARIKRLVYGVDDPKTGAIRTVSNIPDSAASNHRLLVLGGIMESACREQIRAWFANRRNRTI